MIRITENETGMTWHKIKLCPVLPQGLSNPLAIPIGIVSDITADVVEIFVKLKVITLKNVLSVEKNS